MGEEIFVKLRDCFTAGYTLPQYCIDNGIKRPLFVSEKKFELLLWEIHVQFYYDKRMTAQFSVLDEPTREINFSIYPIIHPLQIKNFSEIKSTDFDAIIFMTTKKAEITGRTISFTELTSYFFRKTYVDIPLLSFLQRFTKVKLILTNFPSTVIYDDYKEFNLQLWAVTEIYKNLREKEETPFDKFGYTKQEIYQIIKNPIIKPNMDGSTTLLNDEHFLRQIQNGKRKTAYQPKHYQNKIYIFGTCHQFGVYASYEKTIESYLQKMLNEHDLPYRVENNGQVYFGRYQDIFYNLNKIIPVPNDIIIIFLQYYQDFKDSIFPFCDVSHVFDSPYNYKDMFCMKGHVNELGYKILAEKYFKFLTENNFFRDKEFNYPLPPPPCHRYGIPSWAEQGSIKESVNEELEAYKQQLKAKRPQIGALVMNCNPFTLGHQYLVDYAAARVDKLYIFVVEEDKSQFPFADRIELVKQGVKNFSNVEVLPSGKFIISQTTFSGYFNKAELQDVQVDSSEDVEIFGREIAPTLGITVRFAGEEPTDNVTRQYNETMKKILPSYGVEFHEIPRKEFDGEPISASKVREALKRSDFDKIRKLVPWTTYKYLCKSSGQEVREEIIVSDMTRQDLRSCIE